ncbi:PREDICTED: protein disulfide-isomerase 2-like [Amphimedon queenslandica]|uniref:Protein disulfide-isomerase n=1 Tax=Amphimedon queenslandica TaxID=400682 RepID=A0A1X7VSB8_AMPQE|nr:PREDICTED: protein disulfide-isomerase 2-like [Amphimedon queenslandica]|eukprot:XP_003382810.1 PREDICTED: protein disulfide-isomerase 2-like [Amphimedon queenslandica]
MKVLAFLCAVLLGAVVRADEDSLVLVLTKDTFHEAISSNENILVEFYAPWCGHCKALEPEYNKAAKMIEEGGMDFTLAKVDATVEKELAEEYKVQGYPTIKFFKNGVPREYSGGRKANDIIAWLEKSTGPVVTELATAAEIKAFNDKADVSIVGYFPSNETDEAKAYISAADSGIEGLNFALCINPETTKEMEAEVNTVVLYKKFDDGKSVFPAADSNWTTESIVRFISDERLPYVTLFSDETAPIIFGGSIKNHLLSFFASDDEKYETYMENLKVIGKEFRGKVIVVHIDSKKEESERIMEFFGITKDDLPAIRIIHLSEDMKKYRPDFQEIETEKLRGFVQGFLDGTITPHLNTEEVPEDWDAKPVKVLVGKNFKEVALDETKHAFVEFYAPWCGHCKQLAPIWDKLGEHYKDNDQIVIAKMDSTKNEVDGIQITGFPTIKFFPKGSKEGHDYVGGRTQEDLIQYVEDRLAGKPLEKGEEVDEGMDTMEDDMNDDPAMPEEEEEDGATRDEL